MEYSEVSLEEVLFARERRAGLQKALLEKYGCAVLSFTLNLPGPSKRSPRSDKAFFYVKERIEALKLPILEELHLQEKSGLESLYAVQMPSAELKKLAESLEELPHIGRLLDLDVLDEKGEKLSRGKPRPCLVCGGPGVICARSRAHGLEMLERAVAERLGVWEESLKN